jgi:DNA polymerase-3 subunit delta'
MIEASGISPFEADKKIFVILGAGEMSEAAQNKILKTIEEPASETYFLLVATSTSRLLPTILSRVKQIVLDELVASEISNMLVQKGIDKQKAEIYASCSNQNATFAEKLATDGGFVDFFNSVVSCFYEINGSRDVLKFSSMFSAKTVDKEELINIFLIVLRDINMILAGKEELVSLKICLSKLKVISGMMNTQATLSMIEVCLNAKEQLHFNVNSTAVVDGVLFKLAEVKVKCRRL